MNHYTWLNEKPVFTEDCILITANVIRGVPHYDSYIITYDGYLLWLTMNHEEYGDINDLSSQLYFTIPQI